MKRILMIAVITALCAGQPMTVLADEVQLVQDGKQAGISEVTEFEDGQEVQQEENDTSIIDIENPDEDPQYGREMMKVMPMSFEALTLEEFAQNGGYIHNSRFQDAEIRYGIDVSSYQGLIDWSAAKNAGVQFAFIRIGFRGYGSSGRLVADDYWERNIKGAIAEDIPVGVYIYSQAITQEEAKQEADFVVERVRGYDIQLPIVMDFEYAYDSSIGEIGGRLYNAHLTPAEATNICLAFFDEVEANGYTPMLYAGKYILKDDLCAEQIDERAEVWLSQYNIESTYDGSYTFWQYSDQGVVSGINGLVDMDFWYVLDDNGNPDDGSDEQGHEVETEDGHWIYVDADGEMLSGWIECGDKICYYDGKNNGWRVSGFKAIDGLTYYFDDDSGDMSAGERRIDGKWYYFDETTGVMSTGWTTQRNRPNNKYYYGEDGVMCYGEKRISGTWYYFNETTGAMSTGWTTQRNRPNNKYYYGEDGAMCYGYQRISGVLHYFNTTTGCMVY